MRNELYANWPRLFFIFDQISDDFSKFHSTFGMLHHRKIIKNSQYSSKPEEIPCSISSWLIKRQQINFSPNSSQIPATQHSKNIFKIYLNYVWQIMYVVALRVFFNYCQIFVIFDYFSKFLSSLCVALLWKSSKMTKIWQKLKKCLD